MFRRTEDRSTDRASVPDRVDSVLAAGIAWQGQVTGTGGLRIEGAFDGDIALRGLVVVGEQGRVSCKEIRAVTVIIAGSVRGDLIAEKVEINRTGRVWGDVTTASFSTEEGAFLRGKITMEEQVDLELGPESAPDEGADESGTGLEIEPETVEGEESPEEESQ